jgi:diguanylate cyclase (GGDEF)-like protein
VHSLASSPSASLSLAGVQQRVLPLVEALAGGAALADPSGLHERGIELAADLRAFGLRLPDLQRAATRLRTVLVAIAAETFKDGSGQAAAAIDLIDNLIDALVSAFGEFYLQTATAELRQVLEEQREALAMLEERSQRDSLTGLYNHAHFYTVLGTESERARRYTRPLTLLLLDIDHFKAVNDRYGHQRGDDVLVAVSREMTHLLRRSDTLSRYGGEEFAIILPETSWEQGVEVAQKVRNAVAGLEFSEAGESYSVTVSVGVAQLLVHGSTVGDLVRAADRALYDAKAAGRDGVRVSAATPEAPGGETTPGDTD